MKRKEGVIIAEKTDKLVRKIVRYLDGMDLSTLSMQDIMTYANIVGVVRSMTQPNYLDHLMQLASSGLMQGKADTKPVTASEYAILKN